LINQVLLSKSLIVFPNTMNSQSWLKLAKHHRAIAVIRAPQFFLGQQMAKAVAAGGIKLIEITWDSDRPAELIHQLRTELPDCTIGTGTILTVPQLKDAIAAGAEFAFSPHTDLALLQLAIQHDISMIPGALTPTEIVRAWQAGASSVKVFPVEAVGGASYIRCLQAPIGHIPLIPTGGVTLENAKMLIEAGAIAVGLAGNLFPKNALATHDWALIQHHAQTLTNALRSSDSLRKVPL
jgi:2-dehydro-3-deoxyphosphogluconate aldolase/(4S)-4-hydroxy-2-oxoglutarate aldolase